MLANAGKCGDQLDFPWDSTSPPIPNLYLENRKMHACILSGISLRYPPIPSGKDSPSIQMPFDITLQRVQILSRIISINQSGTEFVRS
ncbi:hypothetical protein SLA2020_485820 [Shorea laevis]